MISHEYRFIFIHIPKCAGTSIEMALGHSQEGRREPDHRSIRMIERPIPLTRVFSTNDNLFQLVLRARHSLKAHKNPNNRHQVSSSQYAGYFKFTVVRNPWARAHSWYMSCMRNAPQRKNLGLPENMTFKDFLKTQAGRGALRPQTSWITDFRGQIPLDFIAKFERLENDFHRICSALQIAKINLPHERKAGGEDYHNSYDDQSARLISQIYREEIDLLGYSFSD